MTLSLPTPAPEDKDCVCLPIIRPSYQQDPTQCMTDAQQIFTENKILDRSSQKLDTYIFIELNHNKKELWLFYMVVQIEHFCGLYNLDEYVDGSFNIFKQTCLGDGL